MQLPSLRRSARAASVPSSEQGPKLHTKKHCLQDESKPPATLAAIPPCFDALILSPVVLSVAFYELVLLVPLCARKRNDRLGINMGYHNGDLLVRTYWYAEDPLATLQHLVMYSNNHSSVRTTSVASKDSIM